MTGIHGLYLTIICCDKNRYSAAVIQLGILYVLLVGAQGN